MSTYFECTLTEHVNTTQGADFAGCVGPFLPPSNKHLARQPVIGF